jgi:hypothetical protein
VASRKIAASISSTVIGMRISAPHSISVTPSAGFLGAWGMIHHNGQLPMTADGLRCVVILALRDQENRPCADPSCCCHFASLSPRLPAAARRAHW